MDLKVTSKLAIIKGHGLLPFPPVLKQDALNASIQCHSLAFEDNEEAANEPLFLVCSGSSYHTRNSQIDWNVLGMFLNKQLANIVTFAHSIPLTSPPGTLGD